MKAIVHIGAPKTGSSSIQAFLTMNLKALRRQGFRIGLESNTRGSHVDVPIAALARIGRLPQSGESRMRYGAPDLATAMTVHDKVAGDLEAFAERHPNKTLIITAEHILPWLNEDDAIKSMDAMLSAHFDDVTYVLYLRSPVGQILSAFSERIKRGRGVAQDVFVKTRLTYIDQYAEVTRWVTAVGRDRFQPRLLESDFLTDGDLIADFAGVCGISLNGLETPERMNESLTAEAVEVLSLFNQRVPQIIDVATVNPMNRGVMRRVMRHPKSKTPIRLTADQLAEIAAATAESSEKLRAAYFPDRPMLYAAASKAGAEDDRTSILARALEIAVDLVIDVRSGTWGNLDEEDQALATVNRPDDSPSTIPRPVGAKKANRKRLKAAGGRARAAKTVGV